MWQLGLRPEELVEANDGVNQEENSQDEVGLEVEFQQQCITNVQKS